MKIGGVRVREFRYTHEDKTSTLITFVCISDIPEKYRDEFCEWLGVSTQPLVPGNEDAIYSWDWERWFNMKTRGIPTMWD